jgi:cysteine desulfurase
LTAPNSGHLHQISIGPLVSVLCDSAIMSDNSSSVATNSTTTTEETNVWITLGGLALGVGGFVIFKGLQHLYVKHKAAETEWIEKWSTNNKNGADDKNNNEEEIPTKCIYLDYNGTTPIYKDVLQAMWPYLTEHFGNPSSSHAYGKIPRQAVDYARAQILQTLLQSNEPIESIWFTGCGTESDNLAIQLALQSSGHVTHKHIVTCNVEHPAIEAYLQHLEEVEKTTISVTYVPVQSDGRVLADDVIAAMQENTVLVTIMLANNESGAIQPIAEIATECRKRGILIHTDAAQAAGKRSCAIAELGYPDMISLVGHKLGAPKGIAALYVRPGCLEENGRKMPHSHGILLIGGGQEFGRRGGTENTPYIVGMGHAAQMAHNNLEVNAIHMEFMRARLWKRLQDQLGSENVRDNGPDDPQWRLCNTLSVGIKDVHSGTLLADIGHLVAASAGATCHSAGAVSSVLMAMNVPMEFARGTLRLSVGPRTTPQDIDRAATIIADAVRRQWESKLETTPQEESGLLA